MNILLDPSHVCLVKKWRTFQTMRKSADEVSDYLVAAARSAITELKGKRGPDLRSYEDVLVREHWFDVYPAELEDFGGTGLNIMRFGIENIHIESLTDPDAEQPCRAYAYTPDSTPGVWAQVCAFLKGLPVPEHFSENQIEEDSYRYLYAAPVPILTAEDFSKSNQLRQAFCAPLITLLDWYAKNRQMIQKLQMKK